MSNSKINDQLVKSWHGRFANMPCFVVGNSPSLNLFNVSKISSFFTIGINRTFFKFSPTITFWQDKEFWITERNKLNKCSSIMVCNHKADPQKRFFHFQIKGKDFKKSSNPSVLHGRGSSGPLAVIFAKSLGCHPIFGIGMDCETSNGNTDFYGINSTWKDHTLDLCSRGLIWLDREFSKDEFINISKYPESLDAIVEKFKSHARGSQFYKNILLGT